MVIEITAIIIEVLASEKGITLKLMLRIMAEMGKNHIKAMILYYCKREFSKI